MNCLDNFRVRFTNIRGGDIPDSEYFAIPGISNSKLKLIDPRHDGSPAQYKEGFKGGFNSSLVTGSAVHCMLLQPNDFILSEYDKKPSGKLGLFIECLAAERSKGKSIKESIDTASKKADYWQGKLTKNRLRTAFKEGGDYYTKLVRGEFRPLDGKELIVIPQKDQENVKRCLDSVNKNIEYKRFISPNLLEEKKFLNEIALFSDLKITFEDGRIIKLPFKGKLDQVIIDPEKKIVYLNDLKTTSKPCEMFMGGIYDGEYYPGSFVKLSYYRQFSVYLMLLQMYCEQVLNLYDYNYKCNVIVVETTGQNRARVFPVNNSFIQLGAQEFKELICRVAWAEINNDWVNPMPIKI